MLHPGAARGLNGNFCALPQAGAKLYLLIENASWEQVFEGAYRTRMAPKALARSMTAWLARYRCQLLFCTPETSGRLIRELLYRRARNYWRRAEDECGGNEKPTDHV